MAFFDLPKDDELPPDSLQMLKEYGRLRGTEEVPPTWRAFGRSPRIIKARVEAFRQLNQESQFPWDARCIAIMLIAHAKACAPCFNASRDFLVKIGIDEAALDAMCQRPEDLPLSDRERRFVEFTLRVARNPSGLKLADLKEMERLGFSKDETLEMIGVAGFWNMATTVTSAIAAGLDEA